MRSPKAALLSSSGCLLIFPSPSSRSGGGRRGRISSFSPASRRRFRRSLFFIDWRQLVGGRLLWWVTLTCRDVLDGISFKKILRNLLFSRRFRDLPIVWRLEFQERGAAHLHLLIFCDESVAFDFVRSWISLCDSLGFSASPLAQCVRPVRSFSRLAAYISDASKISQSLGSSYNGRYWGIINRGKWPKALLLECSDPISVWRVVRSLRSSRLRRSGRKIRKFRRFILSE